jgi:hypothetical protein
MQNQIHFTIHAKGAWSVPHLTYISFYTRLSITDHLLTNIKHSISVLDHTIIFEPTTINTTSSILIPAMDTQKSTSDGEVSETEIEIRRKIFDLELKALECKSGKLRMELEHKQSKKKRARPTEQSDAGEVTLEEPAGNRIQDDDDERRGRKRIKLEPRRESVVAATNLGIIDLTRESPPIEQPVNRPVQVARVDYSSDLDSDSESSAASLNTVEDRSVKKASKKHKYKSYNEAFPTVCEMPDGSLAQLHCSVCKANATLRNREIRMLQPGVSLQGHYSAAHPEFCKTLKLDGKDLMEESVVAYLSYDQVKAVRAQRITSYKVEVVLTKRAQMESDLRTYLEGRSKQPPKAVVIPSSSTEQDADDEEEEIKPPGRRSRAAFSGRTPGHVNSAASTGKFARKSAPGGGIHAVHWQR